MADFADEFITWVKTQSTVTSLIGSGTACRCYPDQLKQNVSLPALVFYEAGGDTEQTLTGAAGMCRTVFHTYCYGATRTAANNLDEQLRLVLEGKTMTMGSTFVTEVYCSAYRDTGTDGTDDASDIYRYWTHRVYDIWHVEAT